MRVRAGFAAVAIVALLVPMPAAAGGGGDILEWNRKAFLPGDLAVGRSPVYVGARVEGKPGDGPFTAYLVPLQAMQRHWEQQTEPPIEKIGIPLAELAISSGEDRGYVDVKVEFEVPEVPPGRYLVSHCNEGCAKTLGALYDTELRVIGARSETLLWSEIRRVESRAWRSFVSRFTWRHSKERLLKRIDKTRDELEASFDRKLARLARTLQEKPDRDLNGALLVAPPLLLGAAAGALAVRRKRRLP